jgi:hypothetical protein
MGPAVGEGHGGGMRATVFRASALATVTLLLTACTQACAVTRALYSAVVHNSGAPPREERRRIEQREREMARSLPRTHLAVAPVAIVGRPVRQDTAAARALVAKLAERGLGTHRVAPEIPPLAFTPGANEMAIFWERTKALAAHVREHPPAGADYVLLVDVFGTERVFAVHAMGVTREGVITYTGFWNSHQPLYKEVRPGSMDDAMRMVAIDLERKSREARTVTTR